MEKANTAKNVVWSNFTQPFTDKNLEVHPPGERRIQSTMSEISKS